jgi:hypothetical protein
MSAWIGLEVATLTRSKRQACFAKADALHPYVVYTTDLVHGLAVINPPIPPLLRNAHSDSGRVGQKRNAAELLLGGVHESP